MEEKKMTRFTLPLNLQLFAEGGEGGGSGAGAGEGGAGGSGGGKGAGEGSGTGDGKSGGEKTLTDAEAQAKIDAAVKDRLAREKKKNDAALAKLQEQLDELSGKKKEGGGEGGQQGQGADDASIRAAAILAQANQRVLAATATTEAVKLGVDPKYVSDVVRLADMSKIEIGEDGTVDEAAISKALDEVLKRVPVFKAQQGGGEGGFKVGGEGGKGAAGGNGWQHKQQQGGGQQSSEGKRWNRWQ